MLLPGQMLSSMSQRCLRCPPPLRRSRYQLHQLLKVEEGQVAARSSYDPLDLFCGEPPRQLAALRALLAAPQNNLKLFWGGQPVGVAQGLTAWAEAEAAGGGSATSGQQGPSSGCEAQERLLELLVQVLALEGGSGAGMCW